MQADSAPMPGRHPALVAWQELKPGGTASTEVAAITSKAKASVWRLRGAAPSGSDVIAKRASRESAAVERLIYETVIPQVGLDAPAYFGCVDDGETMWLFIEDAGGEIFSYEEPEQRTMAATWLARLHTRARGHSVCRQLPDRGSDHFRRRLDDAERTLRARLLGQPDATLREVLEGLIDQCTVLAVRWPEIDAFCARLPRTVVHGDFAALNIRFRSGGIVAFDWEKAGVAAPVVDMARGLDLDAYWRGVRETWPELTLDEVRGMALVARVFRPLSHNWARKTPGKLRDHYIHMGHTIEALGWPAKTEAPR